MIRRELAAHKAKFKIHKMLKEQVIEDALIWIEALLPKGYSYNIEKQHNNNLWRATYGINGDRTWSSNHEGCKSKEDAILGLLALLLNPPVCPGCATSYPPEKKEERGAPFEP